MPVVFGGSSKIVSLKTNNFNAQILGLLLNVYSSYAKIRVPDPLLVVSLLTFVSYFSFSWQAYLKNYLFYPVSFILVKNEILGGK